MVGCWGLDVRGLDVIGAAATLVIYSSQIIVFSSAKLPRLVVPISGLSLASLSGVWVNRRISGSPVLLFSSNVAPEVKSNIQLIFGIEDCNTKDKYLGLPTLVGRTKRLAFNEIKELVWRKVRSWKVQGPECYDLQVLVGFQKRKKVILSIPISLSGGPDSLSWHYKNSGAYSVKSGYMVALTETLRASVSNTFLSLKASGGGGPFQSPVSGQLKLNYAAVVCGKKGSAGVCVAIRDIKGKVIVALSKPLLGNYSSVTGDLLALREGLLLAKGGWLVVTPKSAFDNQLGDSLIDLVKDHSSLQPSLESLVRDIYSNIGGWNVLASFRAFHPDLVSEIEIVAVSSDPDSLVWTCSLNGVVSCKGAYASLSEAGSSDVMMVTFSTQLKVLWLASIITVFWVVCKLHVSSHPSKSPRILEVLWRHPSPFALRGFVKGSFVIPFVVCFPFEVELADVVHAIDYA
ncbi:hypothetical protein Dsin_011552 [Dipteronia sinensis]|uniref:RNase H type-1 domain-containing protein n=1 Tax=Dipteronia sinensis TaxID=43782 RepID=A0AAE0EE60_9ROSI|nr:hypothetical protein Dsin_011552 [Dipteronia sinensis]